MVEQKDGAAALVAESSNGHGLVFDVSNAQITSLKASDVLVIKGLVARKILAAERSGDQMLVVTDPAALADVIKDGDLNVETPIKFGTVIARAPQHEHSWTELFEPTAYADTSAAAGASRDAVGNLLKGAGAYSVKLDLDMVKDAGDGFKAVIGAHGHINNFNLKDQLHAIAGGSKMAMSIENLSVELTLTWEVAKNTPGPYTTEDRIKLPAPISIPLAQYLGGLPVFLEISEALLVHPALTGGGELAKGSYKLTYNGGLHFTSENGEMTGTSDGEGSVEIVDDSGMSAVAPTGMVIAVAAPRLELSLGLAKIFPVLGVSSGAIAAVDKQIDKLAKAHLSPELYDALSKSPLGTAVLSNAIKSSADVFMQLIVTTGVTRTGSSAIVECSRITTDLTAQVGMNGSLLGVPAEVKTKDVWTNHWLRIDPPGAKLCTDMDK